jgi:hypothetical protein
VTIIRSAGTAHDELQRVMEAQLFYKELGRLLYAIAAADGTVQDKELATLKRIVKEELAPLEASTDHFGTDQAYITEFGERRKALIYKAADSVATAFHGVGKKEMPLLIELHRHLEQHT